jgi:hypothetical protein
MIFGGMQSLPPTARERKAKGIPAFRGHQRPYRPVSISSSGERRNETTTRTTFLERCWLHTHGHDGKENELVGTTSCTTHRKRIKENYKNHPDNFQCGNKRRLNEELCWIG